MTKKYAVCSGMLNFTPASPDQAGILVTKWRDKGESRFPAPENMKRILLLSDTHSHIDDGILKYVDAADEVWHAGDIGDLAVADAIKKRKPLRAVYGNIDDNKARIEYPLHNRFMCEGVDVWITHIGGYPGKYNPNLRMRLAEHPPKLFICGHSHILKVMFDKKLNLLHLNPGAAGKSGFHQVRTMLRFKIDGDKIQNLEIIELGGKNAKPGPES